MLSLVVPTPANDFARPPQRRSGAGEIIRLRSATGADCATLEQIEMCFPTDRLSAATIGRAVAAGVHPLLVATLRDEIVSYAFGKINARRNSLRLFSLATAPRRREKGVGSALLMGIEEAARRRGLDRVHLEVRADNDLARRFYENRGYEYFGAYHRYYEDGEKAARLRKHL